MRKLYLFFIRKFNHWVALQNRANYKRIKRGFVDGLYYIPHCKYHTFISSLDEWLTENRIGSEPEGRIYKDPLREQLEQLDKILNNKLGK